MNFRTPVDRNQRKTDGEMKEINIILVYRIMLLTSKWYVLQPNSKFIIDSKIITAANNWSLVSPCCYSIYSKNTSLSEPRRFGVTLERVCLG